MRPLALCTLAISAAACAIFACSSDSSKNDPVVLTGQTPEQLFRGFQDQLVKTCGGVENACHVNGTHKNAQGTPAALWLGPNDPYQAAKNFVGIIPITGEPGDSKLLTQVEHDGPALVSIPDLFENVKKWVTAEVAAAGNTHAVTDAFYIQDGPNTVSLAKLAPGADGAQLTFDASTVADNLFLDNMKISAPAGQGLTIDTATFIILPARGPTQTDEISGFSGRRDVPAGQTVAFYSGSTILQKWTALNRAKIVFNTFTLSSGTPDAGPIVACKALDKFTASAAPAFKADLGDGQSCVLCHGTNGKSGGIEELATSTLDLRTLDADPARACVETLAHLNPANKAQSELILTCTGGLGGDPGHPVRGVCGSAPASDAGNQPQCVPQSVIDGIMAWVNAE